MHYSPPPSFEIACAEGTLECGSDSYRLCFESHSGSFAAAVQGAARILWFPDVRQRTGMCDCFERRRRRRVTSGGQPNRIGRRTLPMPRLT